MDLHQKIQDQRQTLNNLIDTTSNVLFQKQSSTKLLQKKHQILLKYRKHFNHLYQQAKQINPELNEDKLIDNLAKAVK